MSQLEENLSPENTETKPVKTNKKKKQNKTQETTPSSILPANVEIENTTNNSINVLAAAMAASTTTSTILAAATKATKKIASETVKKISKEKASNLIDKVTESVKKNSEEEIILPISIDESFFNLFVPNTTSITTLLLGLDYIFYVWTFLLILIVGYLSVYQYRQSKLKNDKQHQNTTVIELLVKFVVMFIIKPIYYALKFIFSFIWNSLFKSDSKLNETSFINSLSSNNNDASSYAWLNNCFKWFYFSPETTKTININIVETLNSVKSQMGQSLSLSAKQQLKFDEINFKSVDTMPPKFTNIQTVMNATDNLTLKANVEFNNIDMKVEFKKTKRLLDLKMTLAKAQVLIVLSQNKNHVFSLECSVDQQSELLISFEKNPNAEQDLMQYFETLIQTAARQTILNLELNSLNKSIPSFSSTQRAFKPKPIAPQLNQVLVTQPSTVTANTANISANTFAASPSNNYANNVTSNSANAFANTAASNPVNTFANVATSNSANAFANIISNNTANTNTNVMSISNLLSNKNVSAAPTTPTNQLNKNEIINNMMNNNLNTNINNDNVNVPHSNLNDENNYQTRPYEEEELIQVENALNENTNVSNIQALAAAAAAVNAKQLRNSVNEKRLLVKLIRATNLTNCEEPYIVVELDYPMQKHITDIHRDMSSINEQFFFDIIANSEELTFSIFDRAKDYGNDLVGEAVIPVNDLCSSLSAKRVIQLHRFGQTKTGSITAEFVFIEPSVHSDQNETRMMSRSGAQSRGSASPFDQYRNTISPEKRMLYRDDLMASQQAEQYQQKSNFNPDQLSDNSISRSPYHNQAFNNKNMEGLFNNNPTALQTQQHRSRQQSQQVQQQPQTLGMTQPGRVINRNYLQTQSNNYRAKTLDPRGSTDFTGGDLNDANFSNEVPINTMDKRKRSISRSLKSLFNRSISSTSKIFGKRDKSYEVQNNDNENYDSHSVDASSKKLSSSIKKIFEGKKGKKADAEYNQAGQRIGGGPAISISRPDEHESMSNQNQMQYYPNQSNEYYMQPNNNNYNNNINNSQIDNSNNFTNNLTEDIYNTKQPVLLRRRYRSP